MSIENALNVDVFTTTLDDIIFVLPTGARTIDLYNKGDVNGFYKGNSSKAGIDSTPVVLQSGQAYSFGDLNKPFPAIIIDATGTQIEITANY